MTLHRSLLFTLVFVVILVLTLRLDSQLIRNDRLEMDLVSQAIHLNTRVRQEANVHTLVQKTFSLFRDLISKNHKALFRYAWAPDFLDRNLPKYSLAVALVDKNGALIDSADLRGKTDPELIAKFVYVDYLKYRRYKEDVLFNPKHESLRQYSDRLLGEYIGWPIDRVAFMQMRAGRLTTFRSTERFVGIFWDKIAVSAEQFVYFFCRLDLHEMPDLHIYKTIAASEQTDNMMATFFDSRSSEFVTGNSNSVIARESESDFAGRV